MTIPAEQAAAAGLLRRLTGGEPRETPISAVFVGPAAVFKLRKAVHPSFLDFSTVERRALFARREFELNAPHAPGLYRGARAIVADPDGAARLADGPDSGSVAGSGEKIIDWVVEMAPVPPGDFLETIAGRGPLDDALLDAIADAVAAYHGRLTPLRRDQRAAMRAIADGNAVSARAAGLPAAEVEAWHDGILKSLDARAAWLGEREADGFVRRTHGDLHLGNLCLWQGRPVAFDALEFDEDLAVTDVAYDLAFLLMDIEHRAPSRGIGRAAANRVLNRYVARTGDAGIVGGLPPFLSMRAMVRAHVEGAGGNTAASARYLAEARAALVPARPLAIAIGGLPGTGKSTYARLIAPSLGPAPGALILRSDEIRKRLWNAAPEDRLPDAAYRGAENGRVNDTLGKQFSLAARLGHAVIADATFLGESSRAALARAAPKDAPLLRLWLEAPLGHLLARVERRTNDASDATTDVLRRAAASFAQGAPPGWLAIDTTDRGAALARIEDALNAIVGTC